jgi:hypothetical protein
MIWKIRDRLKESGVDKQIWNEAQTTAVEQQSQAVFMAENSKIQI